MRTAHLIVGGAAAVAVLVVAVAGRSGPPSGKSGGGPATNLELAVVGYPGEAVSRIAERFARRLNVDSNGELSVSVSYWTAHFDSSTPAGQVQASAVRALRDGDASLGLIPSSAFEAEGVTTLLALQAPFRITSYAHAVRATRGPTAERLQAGLRAISLTGLGLVPEAMVRPFGYLKPLLAPSDFAGLEIAADPSRATRDLLRALGVRSVSTGDTNLATAVRSGFAPDPEPIATPRNAFPRFAYTSANIALFPKVDVIVIVSRAFRNLTDGQQAILRRAAAQTRAATVAASRELADAAAYCRTGGTIVAAPPSSLRMLRAKTAPVLAALRRDESVRQLIAAIDGLKPSRANPPPPCAPGEQPATIPQDDSYDFPTQKALLPPVGSYRRILSTTEIRASGTDDADVQRSDGVATLTFSGPPYRHEFSLQWRDARSRPTCRGRVDLVDRRIVLHWNPATPCRGFVALSWRPNGRGDLVVGVDPRSEPAWVRAAPGTWRRVDCRPFIDAPVSREKHDASQHYLDLLRTVSLPANDARILAAKRLGASGGAELEDARNERARIEALVSVYKQQLEQPVAGGSPPGDHTRPC